MNPKKIAETLSVSPQIAPQDMAAIRSLGFRGVIVNRPDGEAAEQPAFAAIAAAAREHGIEAAHVPVAVGEIGDAEVAAFAHAFETMPKPVLAFCRSGTRSATLWALAQAGRMPADQILRRAEEAGYDLSGVTNRLAAAPARAGEGRTHDVVVVGGGAGGIATAASMLSRIPDLDVVILEPMSEHYYQPGWTLVGAGVFEAGDTRREMADLMPKGAIWIKAAAAGFEPEAHAVVLGDGRRLRYRKLVVAPGLTLDWGAVEGLEETLGRNGVTSNYRYDLASYTWKLVQETKGGTALFTQPPMPIKCAGAPQKAMYLSCDHWLRHGTLDRTTVEFLNAGPVLFGVPDYVPPLMEYVKRYGIRLSFGHDLVKVDGPARKAWFRRTDEDGVSQTVERRFDMLHVVPPQKAPDFVRRSPLANEAGWIDVHPGTLRHVRHPDVYALGDATSTPNAKTAAAARKQAPVVAENLLRDLGRLGTGEQAVYDGYGSCPLTVERGKVVLAEFAYGGRRVPSFPKWLIDDLRPSRTAWVLKEHLLPQVYWRAMLKGREPMAKPKHEAPKAAA